MAEEQKEVDQRPQGIEGDGTMRQTPLSDDAFDRLPEKRAMGSRNLQRRQAKAVRRKKVLAERRRLEAAGGSGRLADDVRRARAAPLHSCLVQSGLFENGFGMVALTRKTGARTLALAAFLVDAFCLGVKDALFRELEEAKMESFLEAFEETAPFEEVDPSYARKLLRDAAAYGRSLGLEPHSRLCRPGVVLRRHRGGRVPGQIPVRLPGKAILRPRAD